MNQANLRTLALERILDAEVLINGGRYSFVSYNESYEDRQIEEGRSLITGLTDLSFDLSIGFWVKTDDEGLWFLYLGTSVLQFGSLADAYREAYAVLCDIPDSEIEIAKLKIIATNHPLAVATKEIRDRHPARVAPRYKGDRLGTLAIEEAYI